MFLVHIMYADTYLSLRLDYNYKSSEKGSRSSQQYGKYRYREPYRHFLSGKKSHDRPYIQQPHGINKRWRS